MFLGHFGLCRSGEENPELDIYKMDLDYILITSSSQKVTNSDQGFITDTKPGNSTEPA